MSNIITNKFWEMMGSTATSLGRDSTSSSESPSSIPNPQETRFLFRGRLTSSGESPVVERRCMSTSTPPMAQTPPSIPVPTHSSLSSVNRLVDTVFIDESPRRQRTTCSWSSKDSGHPGKAFSFDHFQFNLYQTDAELGSELSPNSSDDAPATGSIQGQLSLLLNYNLEEVQLEVTVIAASKLRLTKRIKNCKPVSRHSSLKWASKRQPECNPYVRLQLLPGRGESVTTTIKRKTQSPLWNEKFLFPMSYQQSQKTILEFFVRDCGKDIVSQSILGKVVVDLNDPDLNLAAGQHIVRDILSCENESNDIGEIFVSLQYLPSAGRLTVDVIKARNLVQRDYAKEPDTVVKVSFMCDKKVVKSKRTDMKKANIHPVYNESFRFNVKEDALEQTSCIISVYDYRAAGKDELLGRITLAGNLSEVCGQEQVYHWEDMVRNPRSPIAIWHSLAPKIETPEPRLSVSSGENGNSTISINGQTD